MGFRHYQPFAIISAERPDFSVRENEQHTAELLDCLQDLEGVAIKEIVGNWEGQTERSFVVIDTLTEDNDMRSYLKKHLEALAEMFQQEAILYVDSVRNARLNTGANLGKFKGVATYTDTFRALNHGRALSGSTVCTQLNTVYQCRKDGLYW